MGELAGSGICGVAVISAIFGQKDIKKATEELKPSGGTMLDRYCEEILWIESV